MTADQLGLPERMGGSGPLVSVIVPTYRDSDYLPDALKSIGAQSFRNIEVILVDASDVEWVEQLADERNWIQYVRQHQSGVSTARNDGLTAASGKYAAFLDADDYWHPQKLTRQVAALEDGAAASYTGQYFFNFWGGEDPRLKVYDHLPRSAETAHVDLLRGHVTAHTSTLMFQLSAVPSRPFNESLQHFEDVVFAVELFKAHPPRHIAEPLAVRRLRRGSLSDRTDEHEKYEERMAAYEYLAEEYPDLKSVIDRARTREAAGRGWTYFQDDQGAIARDHFLESLRYEPANYTSITLYALTFLPVDGATVSKLLKSMRDTFSRAAGVTGTRSENNERALRLAPSEHSDYRPSRGIRSQASEGRH